MRIIDALLKLVVWWAGEDWDETLTRWQVTIKVGNWLIKSITLFMCMLFLAMALKFGLIEALALFISFVSTRP